MDKLLKYLLSRFLTKNSFTIEKKEENFSIVYKITVSPKEYPLIIGKSGATIKALTTLCNYYEKNNKEDNNKRVYINVEN